MESIIIISFFIIGTIVMLSWTVFDIVSSNKEEKIRLEEEKIRLEEEINTIVNTLNNMYVIGKTFYRHTKIYNNPFIIDENTDYIKIMNIKKNVNGETWTEYCFYEYGEEKIYTCTKRRFFEMIFEYCYTKNLEQSFNDLISQYIIINDYCLRFSDSLARRLQ